MLTITTENHNRGGMAKMYAGMEQLAARTYSGEHGFGGGDGGGHLHCGDASVGRPSDGTESVAGRGQQEGHHGQRVHHDCGRRGVPSWQAISAR